jgi:hypothetical protein
LVENDRERVVVSAPVGASVPPLNAIQRRKPSAVRAASSAGLYGVGPTMMLGPMKCPQAKGEKLTRLTVSDTVNVATSTASTAAAASSSSQTVLPSGVKETPVSETPTASVSGSSLSLAT